MRLTNHIRKDILNKLLHRRFDEPAKNLALKHRDFALKVYNTLLTPTERTVILNLPEGWLPNITGFNVHFGADRFHLSFNARPLLGKCLESLEVRAPEKWDRYSVVHQFEHSHPLTKASILLKREDQALQKQIDEARVQTIAALESTSSTDKLLAVWPELEPFMISYAAPKCQALAIPVADLNAALGLP